MMHVKYKTHSPGQEGIGLFAGEPIEAGAQIYSPSAPGESGLSEEETAHLEELEEQEVRHHGYVRSGMPYDVAFEAIRFLGRGDAEVANVVQNEDLSVVALRDIREGEPLIAEA